MAASLPLRLHPKAKKASKRPKSLGVKMVSTGAGARTRVFVLDPNSASFGDDFLYVFTSNVKRARRKTKDRKAAGAAADPKA